VRIVRDCGGVRVKSCFSQYLVLQSERGHRRHPYAKGSRRSEGAVVAFGGSIGA
jgi:hypothetical protein